MIKYTVITVCKNAEKTIGKTIQNIEEQTYKNIEYIICDGKSTDDTLKIIDECKQKSKFDIQVFSEKDFGIYNAMNRGIARASGDYIIFMNVGDSFYDNKVLEKVAYIIEKQKNKDAIYYGSTCLINSQIHNPVIDFGKRYSSVIQGILIVEMPCHQSFISATHYLREHYFNESYKFRADYEWFVYCYKRKALFINLGFTICNYDVRGESARVKNREKVKHETKCILKQYEPCAYYISLLKKALLGLD